MCQHGFRDIVRDAELRQTGANDAAQIVVDPTRQTDGLTIIAATLKRFRDSRPGLSDVTTVRAFQPCAARS